ncbi:MAG: DNA repair protein RadC [Cryomorphaceae bacterium]|jgi:DNA repair protein RadC|nr:DNA repair protein RadC [Cryomorphaceae bacterium]
MRNHLSIKSWAEDDRPREKMLTKGRAAMSDSELLAILIATGSIKKSALDLAKECLALAKNDLGKLSRMTVPELCKVNGIGPAKAVTLVASLELGRRRKDNVAEKKLRVVSSQIVYDHMRPYLQDLTHEEFYVILLNRANEEIRTVQISSGGLSGTVADGKMIFKAAIENSAHGLILVHNHPSGQLFPSDSDKNLTRKLVQFGSFIDLPILDHLIFADNGYFSFADQGIL